MRKVIKAAERSNAERIQGGVDSSCGGVLALLQCTSAMQHEVGSQQRASQIVRLLNRQLLAGPSQIGCEKKHGV